METGLGVLRWQPDAFWKATPAELNAAVVGYNLAHGAATDSAMTKDDLTELMEQFPDGQGDRNLHALGRR